MSGGRLVAIVGPSGAGKDTLLDRLAEECPGLHRVRRTITRASGGGEDCECLTVEAFGARAEAGEFALHWSAHGQHYGIPRGALAPLDRGDDVAANLSRRMLPAAARLGRPLVVLSLTASAPVRAARLAQRGREDPADIAARLERAVPLPALPRDVLVREIDNDGPLTATVGAARAVLYAPSGIRAV